MECLDHLHLLSGKEDMDGITHHPLSRLIRRMLLRWRSMPATIPGTPATLSRKTNLVIHFSSVMIWALERVFVFVGRV